MKKTIISSAIAALLITPSVSAIEVYADDKNSVEIGGFIDARMVADTSDIEMVNGASRINFAFAHHMSDQWSAFAKFEWGVNPFGTSSLVYSSESAFEAQSDNFMTNRLGFVGLGSDRFGSLSFGKQWSVWYDVVGSTNNPFVWDGNAAGVYTYNKADGAINGSGRADKAVQYRNSFGNFDIGLQTQLKQDTICILGDDGDCDGNITPANAVTPQLAAAANTPEAITELTYDKTFGFSAGYNFLDKMNVSIGALTGQFDGVQNSGNTFSEDDYIYGMSYTLGHNWSDPGLFVAVNINQQEFHDTDNMGRMIPDAVGLESLFSYKFDNKLRAFLSYNVLEAGSDYEDLYGNRFLRQFITAGIHYVWDSNITLYFEGRQDMSDFSGADDPAIEDALQQSEDDGVGFGIRYYL